MKTRIATATVLAAFTVAVILWLPNTVFIGFLVAVSALAAWEWCRLIPSGLSSLVRGSYAVGVPALLLGSVLYEPSWVPLTIGGSMVWLVLGISVLFQIYRQSKVQIHSSLLLGLILLVPGPVALIAIQQSLDQGRFLVLMSCVVVWGTDTFAYAVGKRFGRRKLAPSISPGKTLEGTLGGIVGAIGTGIIFFFILMENNKVGVIGFGLWCLITVSVAVMAVIGDLVESAVKRSANKKDSGTLVPGHGGVLDRVDSLLCAAPIFGSWIFLCELGPTVAS